MLCDEKERIDLYDYIELADGRKGYVVESWDAGKAFDIELDEQYGDKDDNRIVVVGIEAVKRVLCKVSQKTTYG
ncbi:hypothetical protein HNR45_000053 [Negativicoccus succinicivorans]|uniref:Uncharacterized protein n=1 Tax=Negativicoccus succinicivorans TaxID=620903 RepID=A0A841R0U8_9FIRM|nr:hypothetical protein [Negativicoccus succinicivorans]MBB6477031.1 hypothetical protein [Negativicoccus succinicivorans]